MNEEHDELVRQVTQQQATLLERVETLMKRLYAVKATQPLGKIWFVTSALDIFKMQSAIVFNLVMLGECPPESLTEMRNELNHQLITIIELAEPLLGLKEEMS